jgi:hypothetical protein
MRKKLIWLGGAALAALTGLAIAQPVFTLNLSGNEIVNAALGGGGTGIQTPTFVLRNGTGYQTQATGGTVNTTVANTVAKLVATGAITTWNITLPTAPFDGQMVEVACPGGTATTVAMSASTPAGVTIVGTAFTTCPTGGAAASTAEWIYSVASNAWYRVQ